MTLKYIDAVFACDHCNATFSADIDPAYRPSNWSTYDIAVDALRGGHPGRTGTHGIGSIQADMHLCPKCTKIADAYGLGYQKWTNQP